MTTTSAPPRPAVTRIVWPLLAVTALSATGESMCDTGVPLIAASITRDPLAVSAVMGAAFVPWALFGLIAGALADRWPRRKVMILADLARALLLAGLGTAIILHAVSIPLLIAVVLSCSVAWCLFDPAAQALIPQLLGKDEATLQKVAGQFTQVQMGGQALLGPPLGSITFSIARCLPVLADAVAFAVSLPLIRRLPVLPLHRDPGARPERIRTAIRAAVRAHRGDPGPAGRHDRGGHLQPGGLRGRG